MAPQLIKCSLACANSCIDFFSSFFHTWENKPAKIKNFHIIGVISFCVADCTADREGVISYTIQLLHGKCRNHRFCNSILALFPKSSLQMIPKQVLGFDLFVYTQKNQHATNTWFMRVLLMHTTESQCVAQRRQWSCSLAK